MFGLSIKVSCPSPCREVDPGPRAAPEFASKEKSCGRQGEYDSPTGLAGIMVWFLLAGFWFLVLPETWFVCLFQFFPLICKLSHIFPKHFIASRASGFLLFKLIFLREYSCFDKPRQLLKKQSYHFTNKSPFSQSYGFSSSRIRL